jgi:hypothetical protein
MLLAVPGATLSFIAGCQRTAEPTVILPGEPYQLSEPESRNRERATHSLSQQRQR